MLHEAQRTSAPSAFSVSISTRGLDGHVQRAGDARALQRLLGAVFRADRHQARHLGLGDVDFLAAPVGEPDVGNAIVVEMLAHASPGQSELNIRAGLYHRDVARAIKT